MKVFLSWSGKRSNYVAQTLSTWLEQVLQAIEPWISTDIEKGKRWSNEIAKKLEDSKVGIICLTADNLDSNWIHFEAGAISKSNDAYVCTFLFDVTPTNVKQPLSQFQATKFEREDILKLLKDINLQIERTGGKSIKDSNLESIFNTFWPQLEEKLKKTPIGETSQKEIRTDRDLIEESLQILRNIKNTGLKGSTFSESDLNEIIDFWIERYASAKKIEHTSSDLKGHEGNVLEYISKVPEIKMIYGLGELLKRRIKDRIEELLPF